ncbi:conserved hypothetical protein [Pediculus humanus corporis]|uniref:NWD1/2-like winged helix-turn-helix domain-containing protein n=1 Tax=Pediculus humanus subsp. corporis TaxID=121224 RepID=E0W3M6_PEDHC|nr:uncharacterized protein Phum_PHUM607260 [Pediculus humanus corporis]EEB20232.1 conserved hypothetical protein [Pediculus humanus corporis]
MVFVFFLFQTDFVEERRQLLEVVGPDLHTQLDALGIEVEMVDIHYGTGTYDSAYDSNTLKYHLNEIDNCYQVSRGCFFMCLIGDKYGEIPLDEEIKCKDYDDLLQTCQLQENELNLLREFYKKKENGHDYVLQQPQKRYERVRRESWKRRDKEIEIWRRNERERERERVRKLGNIRERERERENWEKYERISKESKNKVLSVVRNWDDFNRDDDVTKIFHDDDNDGGNMKNLRDYVQDSIPEENRFTFNVPWKKGGIDTDDEDHENYISEFSETISSRLHELISRHIKQDPEVKARNKNVQEVYNEVVAHLSINEKLNVIGRKNSFWENTETLNTIRNLMVSSYLAGETSRHLPIIVHGTHLTGKSSLINDIYSNCSKWLGKNCLKILRFANITPRSSYNLELVRIIAHQLCYVLNEAFLPKDASFDPLYINNWFQTLLRKLEESNDKIVVIIIDDLHRLNPLDSDIVAALSWLPISLPYNVHIIATTFQPIEVLKLTPVQRERFKVPECLIELPGKFSLEEQMKKIDEKFSTFENEFGKHVTGKLFNLISCTEFGLTETEILEILMPTNDITDFVKLENGHLNFSTLAAAKCVLGDLILQKEMSGKILITWRHGLIKEMARKRYATSPDVLKAAHAEIANLFFLEFTKNEEKSNVDAEENVKESDCKETPFQSILQTVDVTYNIRHVEEAWLHLLNAGSHVGLKQLCICNFDMALAAVQTISVSYLRSLLEHVRSFLLDRDLELVYYTVRKSSQVLTKDALQLPTQFICWLRPVSEDSGDIVSQMITSAMAWCDGYAEPLLVPLNAWLQPPLPLQIKSLHVPGGVRLMEPTPSSQHLVIVPQSGDPQLWHIMTNALVHTFKGHSGPVGCLCVTKQLPYLVTGSEDTSIIVWDLKTFSIKLKIVEHIAPVLSLCVALNNTVIVSGGEDSRIIVTSLTTGDVIFKIDHHRGPVTSVKITSTTDVLVSGSVDGTICLWSLENKVTLLNTMQLVSPVLLMSLTEDSVFILACCEDNQLYLRTLATGTELHTLRGLKTKVQCISLAYDNRRAVVGGADGRVYIFDLHSGLITRTINSHTQCVTGVKVTDKDDFLITAGGTKVTFWSFRQEEIPNKKPSAAKNHTGHITCLCISRDGTIAATGGTDSLVNIWQMNSHELQYTMEGHLSSVTSVALAANGLFAVSGSEDHTARVWGLTLGLVVSVFRGHQTTVTIVSVMLDSRRVISCDRGGTVFIWLADDATHLQTITGTAGKSLQVSSNMKYAVCAQNENSLRIWSLIRDDEKYVVNHSDEISCFVITMDSTMVITGSKDQSLKVWQLAGGKLTQVLMGHTDHVTCVAVSMNKSQVISGSKDSNLIVWDIITGADLFTLTGHLGFITCVQLSADGTLAISGSEDKCIIVWDVQKGRQLSSLTLHVPILGLCMASDASRIAVHLLESTSLPIVCLHNTPATYVKLPTYVAPAKEISAPDLRPSAGLMKRPMRRLLKKEVSLDTYTWQKKYGHLTSNIMMAAVDERLKRRFSVSASMEEISKIPNQGSQQLGPEQAALAQSQHFDQLEALWNKRSPPRRRLQLSKQNSRQSDPATPLEEDPGLSD